MRELYTEIEIDAPADRVFKILTDVAHYERWNPLIVKAEGRADPGEVLRIRIRTPGAREQPYVVKVLTVEENREFRWLGHMLWRGVLDGEHAFQLIPLSPDRVKLVHREQFRGVLVPLVWTSFLDTKMRQGFEALNRALKTAAEAGMDQQTSLIDE
jgi:hypothetical protein